MTAGGPRFLPDRLRPRGPRRRPRRRLALLTVVPVMLLALPQWRVGEVRVDGCPQLPPTAVRSLHELVGQPALGLDLEAIRDRVEVWPGVGEVAVELQLPGTVFIRAEAAITRGSVQVGRGWHGLGPDGSLAGMVEVPLPPVLRGFDGGGADRLRGLEAAWRLEDATRGQVLEVRRVTPADYRVALVPEDSGEAMIVHVRPEGTGAERVWSARVAEGSMADAWADVRWQDRMVLGGGR
ncbi:MAG: FtsQ-type POTRA domain-containing protein [Acidobacteria bacterium]|nr:FtsQ-type POTRA domain-containing protein [Acidobacteriota bacterium]